MSKITRRFGVLREQMGPKVCPDGSAPRRRHRGLASGRRPVLVVALVIAMLASGVSAVPSDASTSLVAANATASAVPANGNSTFRIHTGTFAASLSGFIGLQPDQIAAFHAGITAPPIGTENCDGVEDACDGLALWPDEIPAISDAEVIPPEGSDPAPPDVGADYGEVDEITLTGPVTVVDVQVHEGSEDAAVAALRQQFQVPDGGYLLDSMGEADTVLRIETIAPPGEGTDQYFVPWNLPQLSAEHDEVADDFGGDSTPVSPDLPSSEEVPGVGNQTSGGGLAVGVADAGGTSVVLTKQMKADYQVGQLTCKKVPKDKQTGLCPLSQADWTKISNDALKLAEAAVQRRDYKDAIDAAKAAGKVSTGTALRLQTQKVVNLVRADKNLAALKTSLGGIRPSLASIGVWAASVAVTAADKGVLSSAMWYAVLSGVPIAGQIYGVVTAAQSGMVGDIIRSVVALAAVATALICAPCGAALTLGGLVYDVVQIFMQYSMHDIAQAASTAVNAFAIAHIKAADSLYRFFNDLPPPGRDWETNPPTTPAEFRELGPRIYSPGGPNLFLSSNTPGVAHSFAGKQRSPNSPFRVVSVIIPGNRVKKVTFENYETKAKFNASCKLKAPNGPTECVTDRNNPPVLVSFLQDVAAYVHGGSAYPSDVILLTAGGKVLDIKTTKGPT